MRRNSRGVRPHLAGHRHTDQHSILKKTVGEDVEGELVDLEEGPSVQDSAVPDLAPKPPKSRASGSTSQGTLQMPILSSPAIAQPIKRHDGPQKGMSCMWMDASTDLLQGQNIDSIAKL